MHSGFASMHPKGYVLQNASRSVTLTPLLRASSLGFIFHLPFSVSVLPGVITSTQRLSREVGFIVCLSWRLFILINKAKENNICHTDQ